MKIKEMLTKLVHDFYGNGSKGIVERMEEQEKKTEVIYKSYDGLNHKLNILIVILVIALGESMGVLKFLGKLFKL